MSEVEPQYRLVKMSKDQADMLAGICGTLMPIAAEPLLKLIDDFDKAPTDYWDQIAAEFAKHRCKDPDCFTETVLMRLRVLSFGNPNSPFGF